MIIVKKVIIRPWLKYFAFTSLLLYLLVLSGSLVSDLLRSNVTTAEVFINQALNTPNTLIRILPLACLLCSLVTLNGLIQSNELTAIFSLGFSREKVLYNILYVTAIVSFSHFLISSYLKPFSLRAKNKIIPNLDKKFSSLKKQGLITSKISNGKMWFKSNEYFFSYSTFNDRVNEISNTTIYHHTNDFKLKSLYLSPKTKSNSENKWESDSLTTVSNLNTNESNSVTNKKKSSLNILREGPKDFGQIEQDITTLNFIELLQYIKKLNHAGVSSIKYEVIILKIISGASSCILFTLLGTIILFSPNKRSFSLGKIIGICLSFTLCYWLVEGYLIELAITEKINTYIGVFGFQIFLSLSLLFYYQRNRSLR